MMADEQKPQNPSEIPAQDVSGPRPVKPAAVKSGPVAAESAVEPVRSPALMESLAALGLLLVVAYTCWRLYGVEIGNMFAVLFR